VILRIWRAKVNPARLAAHRRFERERSLLTYRKQAARPVSSRVPLRLNLDATYLHVRNHASMVTSMAVIVATGVIATGEREILGLDVGDSEDEVFWKGFMTGLKQRGLTGVRLVISDQHSGLIAALTKAF
jgi:transposase-like protein